MENNIANETKNSVQKHDKREIQVCIAYFLYMPFTIYPKPNKKLSRKNFCSCFALLLLHDLFTGARKFLGWFEKK